jgi:hypothetical protein
MPGHTPAESRRNQGSSTKAIDMDTEEGPLVKPLPDPNDEMGSLRDLFEETSEELLRRSRELDRGEAGV